MVEHGIFTRSRVGAERIIDEYKKRDEDAGLKIIRHRKGRDNIELITENTIYTWVNPSPHSRGAIPRFHKIDIDSTLDRDVIENDILPKFQGSELDIRFYDVLRLFYDMETLV